MAELNRMKMRLLGNYNSLLDENLAEYFSNPRIRRHLLRAGLIRQNGEIVSPEEYRTRVLEEQRWLASQAFLAQAIVQRALDLEFSRRAHLQKQLEEIIRLELVERVRSAKQRNQPSARNVTPSGRNESLKESLSFKKAQSMSDSIAEISKRDSATYDIDACDSDSSSSDIKSNSSADFALQNKTRATYSANSRLQEKSASPYSIPLMNGKCRPVSRTRSANYCMKSRPNLIRKGLLNFPQPRAQTPGPRNVQYSTCEISLKFLGTRSFISTSVNGGRQDVLIKQQLAGGNPRVIFYEPLVPGSIFTFTSKRYIDFPFSLTIYVDNILALRLSACCEFKYTVGYRLGGPQGYFMLFGVHGSRLCAKCNPKKKKKFLPPMKKRLPSAKGTIFKSNNTSTWSQRPFSAKKVALITPSGKVSEKPVTSKDSSSWVLNVGISPWIETNVDNLKCNNNPSIGSNSLKEEKENLPEDEIGEEITEALSKEEETGIAEVDEELDSDSNSTESSSGSYTSSTSSTSRETAVEGPKIQVISADGVTKSSSSSSGSETGSYSSSSYSESGSEDDKGRFLKPKDAKIITKATSKETKTDAPQPESFRNDSTSREPDKDVDTDKEVNDSKEELVTEKAEETKATNIPAEKRQNALQKMIAIDSSDDDSKAPDIQHTVVQADVHSIPENDKSLNENENKNHKSDDKKPSIDSQDSLNTENKLERQQSLTISGSRRRSSIYQIVRNASEDAGEKDFNDEEPQSGSVQDNGNEIEVIGQDISAHITELCEELLYRPDLITLTINKGGIDDLNIVPVIDALINSNCPLQSLNLNYNHLGPQAGPEIARLVREKPTLNNLFLRANPLHDSGLCPVVKELLANNSAFSYLQDGNSSYGLHKLDVGNCNFRNEGATNLASLIEQSVHLNTLILTKNNQLNDDDWSSIFWAVGQNSQVSTLTIDYCYIGDEGIDCLTKIIKHHPSLEAVDLEWNQIGDEGAKILLNWIKQNPKLTQVRFEGGNTIKETLMQDINKALENNAKDDK